MGFFLGVVAAVLLVLALAALVAFWWFKRWLRRKVGDVQCAVGLMDPRWQRPARIQLDLAGDTEHGEAFDALWARCHALGFRTLADWTERNGAYASLRAARHESLPVGLVATQDDDERAAFAMFVMSARNQLTVYSDAQGPGLVTTTMTWDVDATTTPESALERLAALASAERMRDPELRLVEAVYERAWATRVDAELARGPERADVERRAQDRGLAPKHVDEALSMELRQWHEQVGASALDRWRRASRIDAVEWERIRDDVHVVHDRLREEDLRDLVVDDEPTGALFDQLVAQGLKGIALYEQVLERAPASARRRRLGEVDRPVRAVLYARGESAAPAAAAKPHTYAGIDADGSEVHGAVYATDSTDARRQLDALGLPDAKILGEPTPGSDMPLALASNPEAAAIAARAARQPFVVLLLGAIWANKWVWGPPALLVAWSLVEGAPYGWGDWLGFAYAALALAIMLWFVAPMFLYNQLLAARMHARYGTATLLVRLLGVMNPFGAISKSHLVGERCKIDAARGRTDEALARWQALESTLAPDEYAQGLVGIHDAAGDADGMIAAQRSYLEHASAKEMASIDLALSLARNGRDLAEVESLIARTSPQNLSELALGGYHYVRGLVCAERGQADLALRQLAEAIEKVEQYRGNPMIQALIAEIHGNMALTLKRAGRRDQADPLWAEVRDLLALHAGSRRLVERYERT